MGAPFRVGAPPQRLTIGAVQESQTTSDLKHSATQAIDMLQERRSALISAAVTGQIDVRGLVPDASVA